MGKESLEQAQKPASQPGIGFGIGYREVSALLGKKTDLCEEHRGYISCWEQRRACAGADIKALPEILVQFLQHCLHLEGLRTSPLRNTDIA